MCKAKRFKRNPNNRIDKCIQSFVKYIQSVDDDVIVKASCCGHCRYPMTIVVHGLFKGHFDRVSGIKIPRKRKFYKRDPKGFYYIPEVSKEQK